MYLRIYASCSYSSSRNHKGTKSQIYVNEKKEKVA